MAGSVPGNPDGHRRDRRLRRRSCDSRRRWPRRCLAYPPARLATQVSFSKAPHLNLAPVDRILRTRPTCRPSHDLPVTNCARGPDVATPSQVPCCSCALRGKCTPPATASWRAAQRGETASDMESDMESATWRAPGVVTRARRTARSQQPDASGVLSNGRYIQYPSREAKPHQPWFKGEKSLQSRYATGWGGDIMFQHNVSTAHFM